MRGIGSFTAAALLAAVAGCTTVSETQFNNERVAIQGSSAMKRAVLQDCTRQINAEPLVKKRNIGLVMNVAPEQVPPLFCQKIVNAIANGQLAYADYRKVLMGNAVDQTKIIKLLQGR